MSDFPQPGYWQATDGLWYPPPSTTDGAPPPPPSTEAADRAERRVKIGCVGAIAVVVAIVVAASVMGGGGGDTSDGGGSDDDLEFAAFDVCKQFVRERLRAPGTAEFRNFFEDDGEVIVSSAAGLYTVISSVDSENGFGANLRTNFVCEVRHAGGDQWSLVDLSL